MRGKCSAFIAASLDGFIADEGGSIEWLHIPEYDIGDGEDFGYGEFIAMVDAVVMGRHSYEKVLTFPEWPYGHPTVVLTSRRLEVPEPLRGRVTVDGGPPGEVAARLAAEGKRRLYIDGGVTLQRFLRAGLIGELTVTIIPVLLGGGLPLFGSLGLRVPLRLLQSRTFENGFVQMKYEVHPGPRREGGT